MKLEHERMGSCAIAKADGTPEEIATFVSTFLDEKIDYTSYLRNKPLETDRVKIIERYNIVRDALKTADVHGVISCTYYADGHVKVCVNGEFYGVFNCKTGNFFDGFVGD